MSMTKSLRWELRKYVTNLRWAFLPWVTVLAIAYLLPATASRVTWVSNTFNALLVISLFIGLCVMWTYPGASAAKALKSRSSLLEKLRSQPFIVTVVAKTILNVLLFSVCWGLLILTSEVSFRYGTNIYTMEANAIQLVHVVCSYCYPCHCYVFCHDCVNAPDIKQAAVCKFCGIRGCHVLGCAGDWQLGKTGRDSGDDCPIIGSIGFICVVMLAL